MLDRAEEMSKRVPDDRFWRDRLQFACFRVGENRMNLGAPAEAIPFYERALQIYREMIATEPATARNTYWHGCLLRYLAAAERAVGKLDEALVYADLAIQIGERPEFESERDREWGWRRRERAEALRRLGRLDEAQRDTAEAVISFRRDRQPHPVFLAEQEYGNALAFDAGLLIDLKKLDVAEERLAEATEVFSRMLATLPFQKASVRHLDHVFRTRLKLPMSSASPAHRQAVIDSRTQAHEQGLSFEPAHPERRQALLVVLKENAQRARDAGDAEGALRYDGRAAELTVAAE
jgi:tetratricopeptide (TPR) repeat protein